MFNHWIKIPKQLDSCFVIKNIYIDNFDDAFINITGLGFYELFINDIRVDKSFYKPTVTDYLPRDLTKLKDNITEGSNHRICYNSYNLKDYFVKGNNEIKILLGNGFYRQIMRLPGGDDFHFGDNLLTSYEIHILEKNNKKIYTPDGSEHIKKSFITLNNIFYGEHHDYSLLNDSEEYEFELVDLNLNVIKEDAARDVISRTIKPHLVYSSKNRYVYDVGENVSGIVSFKGESGDIELTFSEEINKDYSLNYESSGDPYNEGLQIHRNVYKNVKENINCFPYFSFTCFRYFDSNKPLHNVIVNVIHSDVKEIGFVETSNELINWYYDAFKRTMLNNMHYSYPSDCPHRERLGYLGDGQISSLISMMMFDARTFYKKWIEDIIECQDPITGHIQHTAPFEGGGGGPSIWGGAIIIVPYNYYLVYNDISILKRCFTPIKKYIESMITLLEDNLIVKERDWGWALGDWCASCPIKVPEPFINSTYFVYLLDKFKNICELLGEDYEYESLSLEIKESINKKFLNKQTMNYCNNMNSANAFALLIGLGNKLTLSNLENKFKDDIHLDSGFAGTSVLTEVLAKYNPKLLFDIFQCDTFPSFGYIRKSFNASTWFEGYAIDGSHCHHMQAGFLSYFLRVLLWKDKSDLTILENASIRYIYSGKIYTQTIKNHKLDDATILNL